MGGETLGVQPGIDRVRASLAVVELAPERGEAVVVLVPAERTRPVPGGERGRLVEEEELREAAGLHQRAALPAAKLEPARDPALAVEAASDPARRVVEAAAVAVDEAASRIRDKLAERRDAVLQRHGSAALLRCTEQLGAGGVCAPLLVLLRRPAALTDEELPQRRMVQRPEDVGGAIDVEAGPERLLRRQGLDDRALVRVVLGLDPLPERFDLRVSGRSRVDHPRDRADPQLAVA